MGGGRHHDWALILARCLDVKAITDLDRESITAERGSPLLYRVSHEDKGNVESIQAILLKRMMVELGRVLTGCFSFPAWWITCDIFWRARSNDAKHELGKEKGEKNWKINITEKVYLQRLSPHPLSEPDSGNRPSLAHPWMGWGNRGIYFSGNKV